ncbi:MAG: phospholipase D-like domain-containing protein [PVC group bacterium]
MRETPKRKIDRIIGVVLLAGIGLFVGRHFLSGLEGYPKIEAKVSRALHIPEVVEKVVEALNLGDDRDTEEFQRDREAKLEKERRPVFDLEVPPGGRGESKYEVTPLVDKGYYPALRSEIGRAKKSIYVSMFVIARGQSASDPVTTILNDLIAAKRRGVDVKVVVENPRGSSGDLYRNNEEAIGYLQAGGVEAAFNEPNKQVHDKFVLIDGETLLLGNHNWSRQALTVNREVSALVRAYPADPAFIRHFANIKLARPEETKQGRAGLIKELHKELLGRDKEG